MSFFSEHRDSVQITADLAENEGLWDCQQGAYWSLQSHFVTQDERTPAIVSLPTGAGKTALMMVMAFARECERALVVAPSKVVRHQTHSRFEKLSDLEKAGILSGDLDGDSPARPDVNEITGHVGSDEWDSKVEGFDVVVALPQSISPKYGSADSEIALPPQEKFDLVLIDEGHHASAPAWKALVDHFSETERILLTATAFRRDRASLPGQIAYHYPVNKAVDDEIYQPLDYHSVEGAADQSDPDPVCEAAARILSELRESADAQSDSESTQIVSDRTESKSGSDARPSLLARTNTTGQANRLVDKYDRVGLDVKPVHSDRTNKQNEDAINELNSGQIDGIVGVNAISEGLDAKQLQIAALHELPKSFPFTYQLLGRIARSSAVADRAIVIAATGAIDTDAMREAVQRLYVENTAWGELIPELVDQFVNRQEEREQHGPADPIDVFEETELNPHQSLRLYNAAEVGDWESVLPEVDHCTVRELTITDTTAGFRGFVTKQIDEPSWGIDTGLEFSQYDLHLFYKPPESDDLYEFTTDEALANQFRDELFQSLGGQIPGRRLAKFLQAEQSLQYHITGLANSSLPSGRLPAYKTFLGDDVQGAVQPSDGRVYTTGHALASLDEDTTRGISADNGRIWEQGRKQIDEFVDWCDELDAQLLSDSQVAGIKGLEFLNTLQPIAEFETEPILVIQNPRLLTKNLGHISPAGYGPNEINSIVFEVADFDESQPSTLELTVYLELELIPVPIDAIYDVGSDTWSGEIADHTFVLDKKRRTQELPGNEFFSEFPPFIYTDGASAIIGGEERPVEPTYENLQDVIEDSNPIDWSDCNISEEEPPGLDGDSDPLADSLWSSHNANNSVHQKLVSHIKQEDSEQILFYDHKSGEIADVIQILPEESLQTDTPTIRFFHCKGTSDADADPTANLDEIKDVQQQVLRNTNFIRNVRLPKRIQYRASGNSLQHFISNSAQFDQFAADFRPGEWEYEVYIVHPGLDPNVDPDSNVEGERTDSNVNTLLCVCYEWVRDAGADFSIWGGTGD